MNVNDLHQIRSEAVKTELQCLNKTIQDLSSTLAKKQEEDEINVDKLKSNPETTKQGEYLNWTHIYEKCNNWVDTDELQNEIKKSKQKFSKLKKNYDMMQKGQTKKGSFCCSSQNREAEVKVIKVATRKQLKHMKSFR